MWGSLKVRTGDISYPVVNVSAEPYSTWRHTTLSQEAPNLASAGVGHAKPRAHLLRALVVGIVVAGGQGVGAHQDAPLDLRPEARLPHGGALKGRG